MGSEPPLAGILQLPDLLYLLVFSVSVPIAVALFVVLMICSALISGSEVAFFSLSPEALESLRAEKSRTAKRILELRRRSRRLLATILISNTVANVAMIIVAAYLMTQILPDAICLRWSRSLTSMPLLDHFTVEGTATAIRATLTVFLVTFLLVLFGEVMPKVHAKLNTMRLARLMAHPVSILVRILNPFSSILAGWTRFIEGRLRRRNSHGVDDAAIKDDIDAAIDLAIPGDANSRLEADILKSIIKFNDVPVKQIMHSRVDIVAIDDQMSYDRLKEIVRSEGYSRLPVYKENLDNILGILYVKDLIGNMDRGDDFVWQDLVRAHVLYVPESKKINELLKEFQKERMHMGIVVDEYGGTSGIVTLEDVMEEVIGEIKDEFDEAAEGDYRKIDSNTYLFDGKMLLNDVCRIIGVDSSELDEVRGDADSLAGLILELSGRMPERGEEFAVDGLVFTVIGVTPRRIEKIRVRLKETS